MDFFEHQDRARRNSGRLVFLFVGAVLAIIPIVYLAVVAALNIAGSDAVATAMDSELGEATAGLRERVPRGWWMPEVFLGVAFGVAAVVTMTSLFKIAQLRGGGAVVASRLGGRPLSPDTTDPDERKILNVVEEMAIASGTATPPVFILDKEAGINAFAAGYTPKDAVIGVTRGCVATLDRDELQGVMAHEFSHILNGDMRLNIRLMGIVHGILALHLLGRALLRFAFYSSLSGGGRRSKEGNSLGIVLLAGGAALALAGLVGSIFGELIKAGVSRQREYLADASAVQFTRQPEGIAGALKKIGGMSRGSKIRHPNAEEASHLFFGSAVGSMFATHPPLPRRIRRIDPGWDGTFPRVARVDVSTRGAASGPDRFRRATAGVAAMAGPGADAASEPAAADAARPDPAGAMAAGPLDDAIAWIGSIEQSHIEYARWILNRLPTILRDAAREPYAARAVVYALLLDDDGEVRRKQFDALEQHGERGMARETFKLYGTSSRLPRKARVPLLELAIGSLRSLTDDQYERFRGNVERLAHADGKLSLFEWMLERVLARHLDAHFRDARPVPVEYDSLRRLGPSLSVMLSTLAHAGHRTEKEAREAFAAAARVLAGHAPVELLPPSECGLTPVGEALDKLERVAPKLKKVILAAGARCVASDGKVRVEEAELLRAIADDLDCPMPPLLAGQEIGERLAPA